MLHATHYGPRSFEGLIRGLLGTATLARLPDGFPGVSRKRCRFKCGAHQESMLTSCFTLGFAGSEPFSSSRTDTADGESIARTRKAIWAIALRAGSYSRRTVNQHPRNSAP